MEISFSAIYVLWLREMKRFFRSGTRIIGTVTMPLFYLIFLGLGFRGAVLPGLTPTQDYIHFLVPGIMGMTLIFSSMMAGISVLWDREFGFLKEILIAPVNRISIVLGRMVGGMTTSLIQAFFILIISFLMGFRPISFLNFLLTFLIMVLISAGFLGLGLIFASIFRDIQGFGVIVQLFIMPLFFLSGALFPISNLPSFLRYLCFLDPLTYGVEGLRYTLLGSSYFSLPVILIFLTLFFLIATFLGAYLFEKSEI